jgi:HSP20 family protein
MSIARWDPFLELKTLEDRLSRWLDRSTRPAEGSFMSAFEFSPPADVYEDESKIALNMEVPGIKQEDLDIHIDGNTLSVSGERKVEQDEKRENFRRVERQYGSFSRAFELPPSADCNKISANFQDGVLQIEVPKRAEARGKQIQISGGTSKAQPVTAKEKPRAA